jgi:hypothetical protein
MLTRHSSDRIVHFPKVSLVVTLACFFAAPAFADELRVSGQIAVGLSWDDNFRKNFGGQMVLSAKAPSTTSVRNESSFLTFSGSEALSVPGYSAWFQLQSGVDPAVGSMTSIGKLEQWVGVNANSFSLHLGHGKSLYTRAYERLDMLSGYFTVGINGYGTAGSVVGDGYGDDGYSYRISDAVRLLGRGGCYSGGIEFSPAASGQATLNAALQCTDGPAWWQLALNSERTKGTDGRLMNLFAGAGTQLFQTQINVGIQLHRYRQEGYHNLRWSTTLGAERSFGPWSVYGNWVHGARLDQSLPLGFEAPVDHIGLGASYAFGRKTSVRFEGGLIRFRDAALLLQRTASVSLYARF